MDGQELTRRMKEALESVIGTVSIKIEDHTTFMQQLGMDYLDLIEYEMELEEVFGITVETEPDIETVGTFGELKTIVERKLKEAGR